MSDKPDLKIVDIGYTGLQNVPAMMRKLADAIDNGDWGDWTEVVLVLNSEKGFEIFGWGVPTAADASLMLAAGLARFTQPFVGRPRYEPPDAG